MVKENTTEINNPFTQELGFKQPIVIHNENGYTIQRTDKNNDMQILTHVGWKAEESIKLYDATSGLAQYRELKGQGIEGITDYMSKTAKPLVITNEFANELKLKKLAEEIERAASVEGMRKNRITEEDASAAVTGTPSVSTNTSSATGDSQTTAAKGKVPVSEEPALRPYDQRLSGLQEENENMGTLGTAFSFVGVRKAFADLDLKEIFENLLPNKSGKNNDHEQSMDL